MSWTPSPHNKTISPSLDSWGKQWSWGDGKLEGSLGSRDRARPGESPSDRSLTEWTPASPAVEWGPRDVHFLVRCKAQAFQPGSSAYALQLSQAELSMLRCR